MIGPGFKALRIIFERTGQIDCRTDIKRGLLYESDDQSLLREDDLCKSGVGLATAMLELLRLEGVGDFGPSTLL